MCEGGERGGGGGGGGESSNLYMIVFTCLSVAGG